MWFLFGLITLTAFTIWSASRRIRANWNGDPLPMGGVAAMVQEVTHKSRVVRVNLGCPAVREVDLTVRIERWWDRLFKWLGISVEYQVGCDRFDNRFYLITDQPLLGQALASDEALRQDIMALPERGAANGVTLKALHLREGRLWAELTPNDSKNATAGMSHALAYAFVPLLAGIARRLEQALPVRGPRLRDPFAWKAALVLAVSTGAAGTGVVHLLRIMAATVPFTVDSWALVLKALLIGALLTAGLMSVAVLLLGRSARTHLVLIELAVVGYFGAAACTFVLARDLNMEFDRGMAEHHVVRVQERNISRGKHTRYYLHVQDWTAAPQSRAQRRIEVNSSTYHRHARGDLLSVEQRPGFLGYRWVAGLHPAP